MTIFPGDELTGDQGKTYRVERLVAYQGKDDCTHPMCRRAPDAPGCMGYHCPGCDEPVSMMGHNCPNLPTQEKT